GAHSYYQCLATDCNTFPEYRDNIQGYVAAAAVNYNQGNSGYRPPGTGSLPSNTIANPKGELKAITTRSGLVLDGPSIPMPHPFINPEEDKRVEETLTDPEHGEFTIKVPPPLVQKAKPPSQRNYVVHQRDPRHPHIPYPLRMNQEKQKEKDELLKSLLSNKEKLLELANTPLNENCSAVIFKKLPEKLGDPGKFLIPCGFSEHKCKALTDLGAGINLMPLSVWKKLSLPELISTQMTLELANREICTPVGIARDVFVSVGKFTFPVDFVIVDYERDPRVPLILGRPFLRTACALIDEEFEAYLVSDSFPPGNSDPLSPLPPFHNSLSGSTTYSSPSLPISETSDYSLEEFADELAPFTFPPGINYLPFDAEFDLREIEYLLNHDPIKEMDSILEDSVDSPDDNLIDTIFEMFTDEHALDYSSPPLWDDYNDELLDLKTVNDNTYDDAFDSEEEKIKESKLLIDELDFPGLSDFLPFPECDLVFYEDFSEVDALSSTNNEDKVFNLGILIHENHFKVINCATPDKNVKKISNASLILEDFNPPLYEIPFHKEVPGSKTLLSFSFENEEKVFNLEILSSKEVHTSLLLELSHRDSKSFKVIKIFETRWRFFLALMERTSVPWMFRVSIYIPLDKLKYRGIGSS
ncbi:reverse transcriptase domain-containing protein, partial [Tanacetum coccineum]